MHPPSGLIKFYIAKQLGINPMTLSHYRSGKRQIPLETAVKLAEILECEVTDLYIK
ncbi:helix-turn-helix domain-containing protein [Lentibacillus halodurans]|uniref:helix-turn-helix domain-containing protein n=1 Tax=Lentibacillus halodurans TaxID=237679 RepID=UPI000B7F5E48